MAKFGQTGWHWFGRGLLAGLILFAGLNAASYLFRSVSIQHLFDGEAAFKGSIGFPFELWLGSGGAGTGSYRQVNVLLNIGVGLLVGSVIGAVAALRKEPLNAWVEIETAKDEAENARSRGYQFSLGGLMVMMVLVSVLSAAITAWAGTSELLWFIYVLGPISMIGIAFAPRNIGYQLRCVILLITALLVIAGAVWTGHIRGLEFDRTLLGIFIFWTPQSAIGAIVVLAWSYLTHTWDKRSWPFVRLGNG